MHVSNAFTHYSTAFSRYSSHTRTLTPKLLMHRPFVRTCGCFKACCNAGFKIGAVDTAAGVKGSRKESLLCVVLKQLKSHDCSIEQMPKELAPVRAAGDLQVINQPINQSINQSINRSINRPINRSIYQSINHIFYPSGSSENPADDF